jgi:hypothetical protein
MVSFLSVVGPGIAMLANHRIGDTSSALLDLQVPQHRRRCEGWADARHPAAPRLLRLDDRTARSFVQVVMWVPDGMIDVYVSERSAT